MKRTRLAFAVTAVTAAFAVGALVPAPALATDADGGADGTTATTQEPAASETADVTPAPAPDEVVPASATALDPTGDPDVVTETPILNVAVTDAQGAPQDGVTQASSTAAIITAPVEGQPTVFTSPALETDPFVVAAVRWDDPAAPVDRLEIKLRFKVDGTWGEWFAVDTGDQGGRDDVADSADKGRTSSGEIIAPGGRGVQLTVTSPDGTLPAGLSVVTVPDSDSPDQVTVDLGELTASAADAGAETPATTPTTTPTPAPSVTPAPVSDSAEADSPAPEPSASPTPSADESPAPTTPAEPDSAPIPAEPSQPSEPTDPAVTDAPTATSTGTGGGQGTGGSVAAGVNASLLGRVFPAKWALQGSSLQVVTRGEWGVGYSDEWEPSFSYAPFVVVHHTAGTNDYNCSQSAAIVKGIHNYHAYSNGWGDIGYNYLIDKCGTIFEGRSNTLTASPGWAPNGGHALGTNSGTLGISVLGDYDKVWMPDAAVKAAGELAGWHLRRAGVDPAGTGQRTFWYSGIKVPYGATWTLPRIFMHKDVNYTSCPGRYGEARIGDIRKAAAGDQYMWGEVDGTSVNAAAKTVTFKGWAANSSHWSTQRVRVNGKVVSANISRPDVQKQYNLPVRNVGWQVTLPWNPTLIAFHVEIIDARDGNLVKSLGYFSPQLGTSQRIQGTTRYDTAYQIAKANRTTGKPVFVTSGETYADALSVAPIAARLGGMHVLTNPQRMDQKMVDLIRSSRPSQIYIIGGTSAVSPTVLKQLSGITSLARISGVNRYHTSEILVSKFFAGTGRWVYLATGEDFSDALAGAAQASRKGDALMLVDARYSTASTGAVASLKAIASRGQSRVGQGWVLGGTQAIPDALVRDLQNKGTFDRSVRVSGADRYVTAKRIVADNPASSKVVLTSGRNFADALAYASLTGRQNTTVVPVEKQCIPRSSMDTIEQHYSAGRAALGGTAAVGWGVAGIGKHC